MPVDVMPLDVVTWECVNGACDVSLITDPENQLTVNSRPPVGDAQALLCRACYKPVVTDAVRLAQGDKPPNPVTHNMLGWPHQARCIHCGRRAVLLTSTLRKAAYECRGTPFKHSAYGDDRCGRNFVVSA